MTSNPKPAVIALWPGGAPGSEDWTHQEEETVVSDGLKVVRNVVQPSLTVYLPDPAVATGTAAIVCPGGHTTSLPLTWKGPTSRLG